MKLLNLYYECPRYTWTPDESPVDPCTKIKLTHKNCHLAYAAGWDSCPGNPYIDSEGSDSMFDPDEIEHALWELEQLELEKWPDETPYHTKFLRGVIDRYEAEAEHRPTRQGKAARLLREADELVAELERQVEKMTGCTIKLGEAEAEIERLIIERNQCEKWTALVAVENEQLKKRLVEADEMRKACRVCNAVSCADCNYFTKWGDSFSYHDTQKVEHELLKDYE